VSENKILRKIIEPKKEQAVKTVQRIASIFVGYLLSNVIAQPNQAG
jgi:hypothetical protein